MNMSINMRNGADGIHTSKRSAWRCFRGGLLLTFGVILPLGTLLFEAMAGMCADILFDPIPTLGHALLVGLVPAANLLAWLALTRRVRCDRLWLGLLNGLALGISLYYTVLFLPVTPFAIMGFAAIIYFGIGLLSFLPLSPLLAFACSLRYRNLLRTRLCGAGPLPGLWRGLILAAVLMTAVSMPAVLTRIGLRMAASPDPDRSLAGIRWLRQAGREDILHRACYQVPSGPVDLVGWLSFIDSNVTPENARAIYFRVTGQAYNTKPGPGMRTGRWGRRTAAEDFDFDPEQGGEVVAGRLKGLSLSDSRIDGSVDAHAALAYLEWTLVFRNDSRAQREARAQVLLPPGAVVSRLTLWVDGEEREAAFGGRGRVRQAYQKVVRRRRDPVLVTTCGPDRALVQCFPVPPGGEMKTRIGITIPLLLEGEDRAQLVLPRFLERNFGMASGRIHAVWIEGDGRMSSSLSGLSPDATSAGVSAVRGDVTDADLVSSGGAIHVMREPDGLSAWAADGVDGAGHAVLQTLRPVTVEPPEQLVIVIDASRGMAAFLPELASALEASLPACDVAVLGAADTVECLFDGTDAGETQGAAIGEAVRGLACCGGQDNTHALVQAWDMAARSERGVVLWIHGPQSYLLSAGEPLRQRLERRPDGPVVYELQVGNGPNRLIDKLDGLAPLRHAARTDSLGADLESMLRRWQAGAETWTAHRERMPMAELPAQRGTESSGHLVRLWAHDEVMRAFTSGDKVRAEQAMALGVAYSLVTPLTGAVVLETREQYKDAGLEPVPPGSVPTIPEPEIWVLMAIAVLVVLWVELRPRTCGAR